MSEAEAAPNAPATPYDAIPYITVSSPRIDPDRLAVFARLHGLAAPAVPTARVLEIGGGDGLHLTAFAAAFPDSECLSFDLAPTAVAKGRALADAAGLRNIRIEQHDIVAAAETLAGKYDYILIHGVYAWVPQPVQAAIFRLVGRVLSRDGMAVVSYNALPGQLLSQTLRTMIAPELSDIASPVERIDRAVALLSAYGDGETDGDNSLVTALRKRAKLLAVRPKPLLAHDEFGAFFEPHSFGSVCAAAASAGLAYLDDTVHLSWEQGFPGAGVDEAALQRSIQAHDYRSGCLFRHSVFIRAGRAIARGFDPDRAVGLLMSSNAEASAPGTFAVNNGTFVVEDQRAQVLLREAARRYPEQFPLERLRPEHLELLVRLFVVQAVQLATVPTPAVAYSARPRIGALIRAQIERGDHHVAGLDRATTQLSDDFRHLLLLLDGTRDASALAAEVGIGVAEAMAFVGMAGQRALLVG